VSDYTSDPPDKFYTKKGENGRTRAQDLELKYLLEKLCVHSLYLHTDANLCVAGLAVLPSDIHLMSCVRTTNAVHKMEMDTMMGARSLEST
jgi:hypothetical protein